MIDLGTLVAKIALDDGGATGKLKLFGDTAKDVEGKSDTLGAKIQSFGGKLKPLAIGIAGATTAIVAGGVAVTKMAMDFEQSFAKVTTLLDANTTDFDKYKQGILDASKESGIAVGEFSEAVYGSISAGIDSSKAIEFTADAMKLAKGGFTDGAKAVDVLTTALNGYKLGADETGRVSDLLITTQNLGKTTVDELASSMGKVIPIASAGNFSIEELSASYATLTKNGIATAESGTYLKSMLGELTKAGSTTDKALKELTGQGFAQLKEDGMSTTDILQMLSDNAIQSGMSLKDMFGSSEAGTAAMVLMSESGAEYNDILNQMRSSAGATEEAFKKMSESPQEMFNKLLNNAKIVGIELGQKLLPIANKLMQFVLDAMPQIQQAIQIAFDIVGKVISISVEWIEKFIGWIKTLVSEATTEGTALNEVWETIKTTFMNVFNAIMGFLKAFIQMFQTLWQKYGDTIKIYIEAVLKVMGALFKVAFDLIADLLKVFSAIFKGDWEGLGEALKNLITNLINNIINLFNTWLDGLLSILKNFIPKMIQGGKDLFNGLWDGIKGVWTGIQNWVSDKISWLTDKLTFWKKSSKEMDGSHRTGLREVPFDGYIAELHKGERILTQAEAKRYNERKTSNSSTTTNNNTVAPVFNIYSSSGNPKEISREIQNDLSKYNRALGLA
jgi:TP901 family phage tail tape measure protein